MIQKKVAKQSATMPNIEHIKPSTNMNNPIALLLYILLRHSLLYFDL